MSKLPNAPLQEVIFELKWKIKNKVDLEKFQYLHGDLYSELKKTYPFREALIPPDFPIDFMLNKPVYRYRNKEEGYPLYQLGPGIISLNTTDENYYWEDFYSWSDKLITSYFNVYQFSEDEKISSNLIYLDFFDIDFSTVDVYDFINKNLNITVNQSFYKPQSNPNNINLGFYYDTDLGKLAISFRKGVSSKQKDGVVMQTTILGKESLPNKDSILEWLGETHDFCSDLFKKITEGKLYESFT